jgi:hypothetical protein
MLTTTNNNFEIGRVCILKSGAGVFNYPRQTIITIGSEVVIIPNGNLLPGEIIPSDMRQCPVDIVVLPNSNPNFPDNGYSGEIISCTIDCLEPTNKVLKSYSDLDERTLLGVGRHFGFKNFYGSWVMATKGKKEFIKILSHLMVAHKGTELFICNNCHISYRIKNSEKGTVVCIKCGSGVNNSSYPLLPLTKGKIKFKMPEVEYTIINMKA